MSKSWTFSTHIFLYVTGILTLFLFTPLQSQTITSLNYNLDDQSIIVFNVSDEITSASNYNGFTITIDGTPATFQNAAPTQLGPQQWAVNLNEVIMPGQIVEFRYDAPPGNIMTTAGNLASQPLTTVLNTRTFQCTDFTNSGQFNIFISGVCAPIDKIQQYQGLMKLAMANSVNFDPARLLVRFDWNDDAGNYDYVSITPAFVDPLTGYEFRAQEAHTYPKENPCGYFVTMTPGYDANGDGDLDDPGDFICAKGMNDDVVSEESIPFPAWETDEENTGSVQLDPLQIDHCINVPMDTLFNDATDYNCRIAALDNPPIVDDTAYANLRRRYVRFTYGTNPGRKIPNLYVNGVKVTDQDGNFLPALPMNVLGGYEDPAGAQLIPRTYPFTEQMLLQSLRITMPNPGYEQIGDVFEITLENWNICNQYNPGPASYNNSIKRTARIVIVGSEDPTGPVNGEYCDGETVPSIRVNDNPWGAGNYVVWYDDFDPYDPSVGNQLYSSSPGQSGVLTPPDTITPGTTVTYWAAYEGDCPGENRIPVTLTKYPRPVGTDVPAGTYIICSEDAVNIDPQLYTDMPGSSFAWTGDNGTSGTGQIVDTPVNATNNEIEVTYTILPTGPPPASCPGAPFTIVVTVQPKPIVTPGLNQLVCSGDPANLILTFDNNLTGGATFFWDTPPVTTGGMSPGPARPDPGSADPITDLYVNPTLSNQTATYSVTGISTASGCYGDPETVLVTVVPELIPSNDQSIADNTLCYNDDPGVISGSNPAGGTGSYTFQWQSSPDGSSWTDLSGATGASYDPGPVTADVYYRRLEFSGPCMGISNEVFLDVTPELFAGVISPDQVICFGDTPNDLIGTPASGGEGAGTYTYQWQHSPDNSTWTDLSNGDVNYGAPVDVTADALSFTGSVAASTWFRRMVVSGECMVYSNAVFIQSALSAPPQPVIDIGVADLCEGATGVTYGISTPDPLDDPNGYTWTYDDGVPVTTANQIKSIDYDFPNPGVVSITAMASNGCGNGPVSEPYVVTVHQQPIADAGGPVAPDQCGPDFTFSAVPSTGTGLWTKVSGPGNVTSWGSGQDQPDAIITVDIYGTYSFVWTETNGSCSDSDTIAVTFYEQPVATVGGNDDVCNLLTYDLNATPYSYLGPPNVKSTSHAWTLESGPVGGNLLSIVPDANDPTPTVTVDQFGNDVPYVFRWTETNGSCSDFREVSIYFREQPVSDAGPDAEACGLTYRLEGNLPMVGTGTWSVVTQPAGSSVDFGNSNDEINDHDARANVDTYGIYEFQWTVNNGPCMVTDIVQVIYHEEAIVTTGGDQLIAEGTVTAPLGGSVTGGASTGSWSVVSGTPGGAFIPNISDLNAVFDPSAAQDADGLVVLRLTSEDPPGICPAVSVDVNIIINEKPEVFITSPADGAQFCAGELINLEGYYSGAATEATWTSSGSGTFSQDYFNSTPFSTVYTPSPTDTAAGSVTITLTSDDPDGAGPVNAATTSIDVIIKPIPITSPIDGPQQVCVSSGPVLYRVDGLSGSPLSSYLWTISPLNGNEPVLNQAGNVSILEFGPDPWSGTLSVMETTMGCSNTGVTLDIASVGLPVAHAGTDLAVCSDVPVTLGGSPSATGGSGTYTYAWSPDVEIDDATSANPTLLRSNTSSGPISRSYQLVVTDANTGCMSLPDLVTVTVNPKPVLSPNLDNTVCSQSPAGITLNTNGSSVPAATYNVLLNIQEAGLTGTPTTGTGLLNTAIQNDVFTNQTTANLQMIYDVIPISSPADGGCWGDPAPVRLTVRPEPILDPDLGVTLCSDEPTNIILATTTGSTPALLYEVSLNSQDPDLLGTPTTGTGLSNFIQNDVYRNEMAGPLQMAYEVVPITSFGCRGEATPVPVTIDPEPVMDPDLDATVCSGETSGIIFDTNGISVNADSYEILSILVSPLLSVESGNASPGAGQLASAVQNDVFYNTSIYSANVVYLVRPVSATSCQGDPVDITLTVLPEPVMNTGLDRMICSGSTTGLVLSTLPVSLAADHYNILDIIVDPDLLADAGNAVVADGVAADAFLNDSYRNLTNLPADVVYEVVPVSAAGCLGDPVSIVITVNPEPVLATDLDTEVCSGVPSSIMLDTEWLSYPADHLHITAITVDPDLIPDAGNGTTGDNKTASEIAGDVFTNLTAHSLEVVYEVIPVSAEGCEGLPEVITLTVHPEPVMDPDLDAVVCSDVATGITLNTNGISIAAASYTITDIAIDPGISPDPSNTVAANGLPANAILNDQFTNTGNSPLEVTYSVFPESGNGCNGDPEMIRLTVNPVPDVISTVTAESICNGEDVNFTLTTNTSPAGNVSFDYTVSASSGVSGYTSPVTGLTNGTHIIQTLFSTSLIPEPVVYTVTPHFNGCDGVPVEVIYTLNPSPMAEISGGGEICQGDTALITFNLSGAAPFSLTYETNYGTMTTIDGIDDPVYMLGVSPMYDTNYRIVSVYDGNGSSCNGTSTGQADVLVQETPVASFNADKLQGCAPLTVNFDNFSTGNLEGPATGYYYRIQGETSLTQFSADLYATYEFDNTTSDPIVYEVVFMAESSQGCLDELSREITVNPSVQLNVTTNDPLEGCDGYTIEFNNNLILDGIVYVWEWGDGEDNDTTTFESAISHTFNNISTVSAKTFNVQVSAVDPVTGCEQSTLFPVRISPRIVLDLEASVEEGCSPLTVNAINRSGGTLDHEWFYRVKGTGERNEIAHTSYVTYLLRNQTTEVLTYELIYTGTNPFGCFESDTLEVVVWPELQADFLATPERQVLPNSTVSIQNLTNEGPWAYTWMFGNGDSSTDPDISEYDYDTYGIYQIVLEISEGPCVDQHAQTITIEPITPIVDFDAYPREGCSPLTVDFINKSKYADPTTYYWEFGDNLGYSNAENPSFTFYEPGVYSVSLEASNELGIVVRQEYEMFITVYETPIAQFRVRPSTVYVPDQPVYTANLSYGATQYFWDFGDVEGVEDTSTDMEPYYYYTNPGVYDIYLWVSNEEGCTDSLLVYKAVIAEPGGQLATPNVFTPNPDGPNGGEPGNVAYNDVFLPVERGAVEFHMQVFNRWGELLFESYDKNIGWDGYYKGQIAKSDVYIYRLDLKLNDGRRVTRLGDVFLLR